MFADMRVRRFSTTSDRPISTPVQSGCVMLARFPAQRSVRIVRRTRRNMLAAVRRVTAEGAHILDILHRQTELLYCLDRRLSVSELDTDWMHPWIGLDWIGSNVGKTWMDWIALDGGKWMM